MSGFIDTHTHIYTPGFDNDREAVVQNALDAGAEFLLLPNIDGDSIPAMLALYRQYPSLCKPMIGLHPTELPEDPEPLLAQMEDMLAHPGSPFVAIGEVGIDLYWDDSRRKDQIAVFERQIEWAAHYNLPLVIHSRKAHRELIDTLLPYKSQLRGGVFHCFGGTAEEAVEMLDFQGFYLGIGGAITYPFGKHFPTKDQQTLHPKILAALDSDTTLPGVLRSVVPLERIVVETDAPYLSPSPRRGKRNEPANIIYILQALALVYETTIDVVREATTRNAKQVFAL